MDIKLFDKKYVYLEWSDELEGKDCVLAKTYQDLKDFVNSGDEDRFCKAQKGKEKPFTNLWSECDFCYFDPNLKVKKAWLEGETIQKACGLKWEDYIELPRTSSFFYNIKWDAYEWRIKPNEYYVLFAQDKGFVITKDNTDKAYAFFNGTKDDCDKWISRNVPSLKKNTFRRMTNRELSEYLAKGNGEMKTEYFSPNALNFISTIYTSYDYLESTENEEIGTYIFIRDFGSDEWREPLVEV